MSFTLFLYHAIILILICPRVKVSQVIHDGMWFLKVIIILAVFIASFWMDNGFFVVWAQICRSGSLLYLIVQAYFILN